jgi:uncharacterized protein (TIGR02996 family)
MGVFDSMCIESGLIIDSKQQLIPIVEVSDGKWAPIGLPIAGTNDRYGTMDVPKKLDDNMKLVVAFGRTLTYGDDQVRPAKLGLGEILSEIRGDGWGATWNAKKVSFALIDGFVFDAIVGAVAANGPTAWRRYAQLGLGTPELPLPGRQPPKKKAKRAEIDAKTKQLCEAILEAPNDAAPRQVYVDHLLERDDPRGKLLAILPGAGKATFASLAAVSLADSSAIYAIDAAEQKALKPAIKLLVQFLAWGTTLSPAYGEGQFHGYDTTNPEYADLDGWAKPYIVRARKKYAGMPELIRAVDISEKAWRERGDDDDDED